MNWDLLDFAVAGGLLASVAGAFVLAMKVSAHPAYRAAMALALLAGLAIVWVALAVGIIGAGGPADLLYAGILALGLAGASVSRLRPRGMAFTVFAMAAAAAGVGVIAVLVTARDGFGQEVRVVLVFNALLVAAFSVSGLLFRRAAKGAAQAGAG